MKKENYIKIIIGIVIVLVLAYLALFGLKIGDKQIIKGAKNITTGLDISGEFLSYIKLNLMMEL